MTAPYMNIGKIGMGGQRRLAERRSPFSLKKLQALNATPEPAAIPSLVTKQCLKFSSLWCRK